MKHRALPLVDREPLAVRAAATAAVVTVVHVLVVFGLPIPEDGEAAIAGAVDAIGLLVLLLWARPAVVPESKVIARVTTGGEVVAGDAAALPTGAKIPTTTVVDGHADGVTLPRVEVNPALVAGADPVGPVH